MPAAFKTKRNYLLLLIAVAFIAGLLIWQIWKAEQQVNQLNKQIQTKQNNSK
ncbi:MAG: hypothetical protein K2X48_09360 [Chitinophagaceae bacterium]|nr:hypothetical protein [Chitinophagaceae bacterium]